MLTAPRPIATFDLTGRCALRCGHCYFFAGGGETAGDLEAGAYLRRLIDRRDRYGVRSAFWVGGEPLLRVGLLRAAMGLFARNAVATSGMVSIPGDLGAGLMVSVDGPEEAHDRLRGGGSFARVMRHLAALPARGFVLSTTLTAMTEGAIEGLEGLVERTRAAGVLVGFHVGPPGDPLRIDGARRERVVDRLQAMRPGVLLNSPDGLERFRPGNARDLARHCIYRHTAVAFDTRLEPKRPCTFGGRADCRACGCPVVAEQRAWQLGSGASEALLRALFPRG